jgi:protein-L-isoaspartate(D-aspartate) O-methyltransferase
MVNFDENQKFALARDRMLSDHLKARDITDVAVLNAMAQVPRHRFVSEKYFPQAYSDGPLPIGNGQTISQPYIVALMTQMLKITPDCEVLEIGTGCGYQTAILATLAKKVYTIERHNQLAESAQSVLGALGLENIEFCIGDGSCGWPEEKKFDRIMVTAAVPQPPKPLIEQLKDTSRLIAPVGHRLSQELILYEKEQGQLRSKTVCGCRFVPLIGEYGFEPKD